MVSSVDSERLLRYPPARRLRLMWLIAIVLVSWSLSPQAQEVPVRFADQPAPAATKPLGQAKPIGRIIIIPFSDEFWDRRINGLSRSIVLAANKNVRRPRRFHFLHDHDRWQRFIEGTQLVLSLVPLEQGRANARIFSQALKHGSHDMQLPRCP